MIDRSKIFIRNSITKLIDFYLTRKHIIPRSKTLLLIRIDSIGDYILFRNFIKVIKESVKYKEHRIILVGNEIWKDLAENYDREYIDKFVWINLNKFRNRRHLIYRYSILYKINNLRAETVIKINDTGSNLLTNLINYSGAKKIIQKKSSSVFFFNEIENELKNETYYDKNYYLCKFFQFTRNKQFAEEITESKVELSRPVINVNKKKSEKKYVVLFPGAGDSLRKWSASNFAEIAKKISEISDAEIVICGDKTDKDTAMIIKTKSGIKNITDKTGMTSLTELTEIINNATLLISNETCAVHIAVSVNTNTVCISNGNHIGRFNPYPAEISTCIETIYPPEIMCEMEKFPELVKRFQIKSNIDINKITTDRVFEKVSIFLNGKHKRKSEQFIMRNTNNE